MGRQALHAASLRLEHPGTGKAVHLIGEQCRVHKVSLHTEFGWLDHFRHMKSFTGTCRAGTGHT